MRAADVAELLKGLAGDVREFVAKSVAKFEERFAEIEQRLQDAPAPLARGALDQIIVDHTQAQLEPFATRLVGVSERLSAVEERALVPGPKGDDGEPGGRGEPGLDGKDVDEEALQRRIDDAVGKAVAAAMAALVLPKDGRDGEDGVDGKDGTDGKSVDEAELQRLVDFTVNKTVAVAVASIPAPKDGVDGENGEDGRDALQIDILDAIDEKRSYPRATFARWRGGVIRSFRATDPPIEGEPIEKAGWTCFLDGIHELAPEATNDPRRFKLRASTTSGKVREFDFSMPTPIYRDVWTERGYDQGDLVTYDGSIWHCNRATKAKPGTQTTAPDWTLCAKRGRAGKDGEKGPKGDRGTDGRNGRDLTSMMPDGSKF